MIPEQPEPVTPQLTATPILTDEEKQKAAEASLPANLKKRIEEYDNIITAIEAALEVVGQCSRDTNTVASETLEKLKARVKNDKQEEIEKWAQRVQRA
jgi:hypothetical protein